jgi:hypothetical protein
MQINQNNQLLYQIIKISEFFSHLMIKTHTIWENKQILINSVEFYFHKNFKLFLLIQKFIFYFLLWKNSHLFVFEVVVVAVLIGDFDCTGGGNFYGFGFSTKLLKNLITYYLWMWVTC